MEREYDSDGSGVYRVTFERAGDNGGAFQTWDTDDSGGARIPVPDFGDWTAYLAAETGIAASETVDAAPPAEPGPPVQAPWAPPAPLRPRHPDAFLTPGGRFCAKDGTTYTVELHDRGEFCAPSGRIIAMDPSMLGLDDEQPFTAALPPGTHGFRLCTVRVGDDSEHVRVAAAALVVADTPVATWELALQPGQEPDVMGDGQFFGFGVDAAMGCLLDAAGQDHFAERFEDFDAFEAELVDYGGTTEGVYVSGSRTRSLQDPGSGASLVAFETGWGDGAYPVWAGRDAEGRVVALVADFLILQHAEALPQDTAAVSAN
nr:DUF4241 domain-containing protein [Streptomonospora sp. PA3]